MSAESGVISPSLAVVRVVTHRITDLDAVAQAVHALDVAEASIHCTALKWFIDDAQGGEPTGFDDDVDGLGRYAQNPAEREIGELAYLAIRSLAIGHKWSL